MREFAKLRKKKGDDDDERGKEERPPPFSHKSATGGRGRGRRKRGENESSWVVFVSLLFQSVHSGEREKKRKVSSPS